MLLSQSLATPAPLRQLARVVARPGLRERVSPDLHPNFRDHGKLVEAALLRLLCRLQRNHGAAFFAEAGARKMICEDTGHMPGVGTIPAALARLEAQGLLTRDWCTRGSIMPDGRQAIEGCVLVIVPQARIAPRIAASMAARSRSERIVRGRMHPQRLHELRQRTRTLAPRLAAGPDAAAFERKRTDDAQRLRELAAAWEREERGPPK
jgi:hypothetical protein